MKCRRIVEPFDNCQFLSPGVMPVCEQHCREVGSDFVAKLNRSVVDGAVCRIRDFGEMGICVDGICQVCAHSSHKKYNSIQFNS